MKVWTILRYCTVFAAATAISVTLSFAQGQGGGGGGGGGGSTGGSTGGSGGSTGGSRPAPRTGTGSTTNPSQYPQQQPQQFPEIRRPMYLQGKVVFEDGTPAPPNVLIQRRCAGNPIPEGYTDSRGRFSFEVGRNAGMIPDASQSGMRSNPMGSNDPWGNSGGYGGMGMPGRGPGGISERDLTGCELVASLPGYRSSNVELTGRRIFDNPDVGTLILTKLGNVNGFTISMTSLAAPKKAKKAFNNGVKNAKKKKWDKAEQELAKAVDTYPKYAEAWFFLGQVYTAKQQPQRARDAYNKAVAADKKYMSPHMKLAMMDAIGNNWPEVAKTTGYILKANPYDFPDAYYLHSMANLNLKNLDEAEKSAREAIKMNAWKRYPQLEQILGLALAYKNNYQEATVHLKKYLELAPNAKNATLVQKQLTQLEGFIAQQKPPEPATAAPQ